MNLASPKSNPRWDWLSLACVTKQQSQKPPEAKPFLEEYAPKGPYNRLLCAHCCHSLVPQTAFFAFRSAKSSLGTRLLLPSLLDSTTGHYISTNTRSTLVSLFVNVRQGRALERGFETKKKAAPRVRIITSTRSLRNTNAPIFRITSPRPPQFLSSVCV